MSSRSRAGAAVRRTFIPLIGRRPVNGLAAALVLALGVALVLLLAVIDYLTGAHLSLSVFYLLPVVVVTITLSTSLGLGFAAVASIAWVVADSLIDVPHRTHAMQIWNGTLRFLTMSMVVLLIAILRGALEDAQASERRSREVLAYAAHQLRTPVAGMSVSAEALILAGSTPDQERLLSNLTAESARIGRLVAALLRIARLDEGEPLDRRPTDLVALATEEVERCRLLASQLDVHFQAPAPIPPLVLLDGPATGEALGNLLDNARRHANSAVDVRVGLTGDRIRIVVQDDGPGLPPGDEERAFDRFVSLDNQGGTGLGLAIARGIVQKQGGHLTYVEREFRLDLPVVTPPDGKPGERRPTSRRQSANEATA